MRKISRILIVKLGSIGDLVHTLPAVSALRHRYPEAEIDWIVESRVQSILEACPIIDRLIEIDTYLWRKSPFRLSTLRSVTESMNRLRESSYDVAIDFQGLLKSALIAFASRAPLRIGFSRRFLKEPMASLFYNWRISPSPDKRHVISINNSLVEALGVTVADFHFPFDAPSDDVSYIEEQLEKNDLEKFVVINPGGGWPTKLWPAEKYAELSERIYRELGLKSVVTIGKDEEWILNKMRSSGKNGHLIFFPTTIKQLIPLVKNAVCFISGDTGPLHIAAAVGTPIVGIYGPTFPERNGSFSRSDLAVKKDGLLCLGCYKRSCPFETTACMEIPVDAVLQAVLNRFNQGIEKPNSHESRVRIGLSDSTNS